jgi:hypothetical protein
MIGAALMPVLLGSTGLAVDAVQVALWKRQLQRAADSAAIAGAHALAQGAATDQAVANDLDEHVNLDLDKNDQPVVVVKTLEHGSWADGAIASASCADRRVSPCWNKAVQIGLDGQRSLPFMSIFTGKPTAFSVDAAAAVVSHGEYCLVALDDSNDTAIDGKGGGTIDLGCGMASNSRGGNAIDLGGGVEVIASPLAAVGNIDARGKNIAAGTELLPYSQPVADPFASRTFPPLPSSCGAEMPADLTTIPDGACYENYNISNDIAIADGATIFVNNGTFDVQQATVTGKNVTIILMGDRSDLNLNGKGELEITAPDTGPLKGIALYRDREAASSVVRINGGGKLGIVGAIYMPTTHLWLGGGADIDAECLQVVTDKIDFKGNAKIANQCGGVDYGAIRHRLIRLVK